MSIAIIGAGLAGLVIAEQLSPVAKVTLFEKSRGVGGRLSTRRADEFVFDHGAQYFTARSDEFKHWLTPLIDTGVVQSWEARYAQFEGMTQTHTDWPTTEPRWVGALNMNSIGKHLASTLAIKLNTRITKIERLDDWVLTDELGHEYGDFDWVIITAPSPQALELVPTEVSFIRALEAIPLTPCFALMIGLRAPITTSFDCAHITNSDLGWIALNHTKPSRPTHTSIVAHSSVQYAVDNWEQDKSFISQHLMNQVKAILDFNSNDIAVSMLHGWKFANTVHRTIDLNLIDTNLQIAASGDYCQGGRVEGAFLSALKTANQIRQLIESRRL